MNDKIEESIREIVQIILDASPISRGQLKARGERLRELEAVYRAEMTASLFLSDRGRLREGAESYAKALASDILR